MSLYQSSTRFKNFVLPNLWRNDHEKEVITRSAVEARLPHGQCARAARPVHLSTENEDSVRSMILLSAVTLRY